jgi:hypothetical protein
LDKKATAKGNILKSLKEKTSQSFALVKIDAQRGFAPPPRQFLFFLSNLSISYLSRYASYPKLRLVKLQAVLSAFTMSGSGQILQSQLVASKYALGCEHLLANSYGTVR